MVEVACELGTNGPRPLGVGNIPQFHLGLLVNQVSVEKLLVDAFFEHSYQKALEAFTLSRLVGDAKKAGKVLPMTEAKDENFANLILGDGVVICPTADAIVAPCNGVITHCSEDNKHAIGLRSDSGQEVLIHVGVDTVGLNGEGFEQVKAEGDTIKLGEPILRFSRKFIESKKLCSDVMVILIEDEDPVVAEYVTGITAEAGKTTVAKIG